MKKNTGVKRIIPVIGKTILVFISIIAVYILTLKFPEPFYAHSITVSNITLYSDEPFDEMAAQKILQNVQELIKKSPLYNKETKHRVFITNNPTKWFYFTTVNYRVGGINYTVFAHSIFLRKADISQNVLYSPSGVKVTGNRPLSYFIAHEITHTLEYEALGLFKYPLQTNWVLEGYADYVAHGSEKFDTTQSQYLFLPENAGAKFYTKSRMIVAYLMQKEKMDFLNVFQQVHNESSLYHQVMTK